MILSNKDVSRLDLLNTEELPVLPPGAPGLLNALSDDDIDFNTLARIIERFPSIAGRLIALANSAWSAPLSPITSLEMACSRLGFGVVRSTSIALAVASPFNPTRCPGFDSIRFWSSALLTAEAASEVASVVKLADRPDPSTARAAGLLHNLGLLWLADRLPDEVNQILSALKDTDPGLVCRVFSEKLGFSHINAGGHLARAWHLPQVLIDALTHYEDETYQNEHWPMIQVVGLSQRLVSFSEHELSPPSEDPRLKTLGVSVSQIQRIGMALNGKAEKNREMAEILFGA